MVENGYGADSEIGNPVYTMKQTSSKRQANIKHAQSIAYAKQS